ncbi:queuosine precursor transporter [Entomospira culicis]|uniref:Probable queuosine precursor transporter n=1 Tax=Entomospira culicis TaxID=2719989 RepID=A0A968L058_9SPIO|nr:queuosine precursor transporter [Entomospira culicis]NIZ19782.1 queuosine precursor transporter [Entomospira culicis]NIZ69996.1 queuosine precursor transporter [Entomospira culicis]WDI37101.1 queuosine precursor transporter [Entomospira culicis]WDI38730.1 queuosine precursor transporter [Entomospira culicis]
MDNQKEAFISLPIAGFVVAAIYVASNIFANILSVKMLYLPFPFPFQEVDAGTIIFPVSFIVRDMLHKNAGRKIASVVVIAMVIISIAMVGLFQLAVALPPSPQWHASGMQEAFALIIGQSSRIALASITALLISGLFNTFVFSRIIRTNPEKKDILASMISNLLSIILDTILFALIAFGGILPWATMISIIMVNIVLKSIIALVGAPLVRLIKVQVDPKLL